MALKGRRSEGDEKGEWGVGKVWWRRSHWESTVVTSSDLQAGVMGNEVIQEGGGSYGDGRR